MAGKLYGVGVGPGDPELMTLKAIQVMEACDVIAAPGKEPENYGGIPDRVQRLPGNSKKWGYWESICL